MKAEPSMKITKEKLLNEKLDLRGIKLIHITQFCDKHELDFLPDPDKTIKENIKDLRDAVEVPNQSEPEPEKVAPVAADNSTKASEPSYLARRAKQIEEAKSHNVNNSIDGKPIYGPDSPAYLKRRGGKA